MDDVKKKVYYKRLDSGKTIQYTGRQMFSEQVPGNAQVQKARVCGEFLVIKIQRNLASL